MTPFNVNAKKLTIRFTCEDNGELVELEVTEIPQPNYAADSVADSENSNEEIIPYNDKQTYRVVLYANMAEGNVEVFNDETGEKIEDIEVEETFQE